MCRQVFLDQLCSSTLLGSSHQTFPFEHGVRYLSLISDKQRTNKSLLYRPNLITLAGLMFMIFNVVLVFIYVPSFEAEDAGPAWIYFSFSLGLWLYSTFDNVDGRQARRTGTSSPLGELFDHGCDALNCSFGAIVQMAALGIGHSYQGVIVYAIAGLGFYFSTIEEYHTGTLYLGYVNVPSEGVVILCIMYIFSGIYGPQLWQTPLNAYFDSLPSYMENMSLIDVYIWFIGIMFFLTHVPMW